MPSASEDWNFGPSKPYLHSTKLIVGDVLTFNMVSIEKEDVDTKYGPKVEMVLSIITSTTTEIPPKEYIWNTECGAARELRNLYNTYGKLTTVQWELIMEEDGIRIKRFRDSA